MGISSITTRIGSFFRPQPAENKIADKVKTVAYPYDSKTGDVKRMTYATHAGPVARIAATGAENSSRLHAELTGQFAQRKQATAKDAAAVHTVIEVDEIAYDRMYRDAGLATLKILKEHKMKLGDIEEGTRFAGIMHARSKKVDFTTRKRTDKSDVAAQNVPDKAARLKLEGELIKYKRVHDCLNQRIKGDVLKLKELFAPSSDISVDVAPRSIEELDTFFAANFKVKRSSGSRTRAARDFAAAQATGNPEEMHAVRLAHLDKLLKKIPFGQPWESKLSHGGSLFGLAKAVAAEELQQAKCARDQRLIKSETINVNGTSFLFKDENDGGGPDDFKLWSPVGQEQGNKRAYQLLFNKQENGEYALTLQAISYFTEVHDVDENGVESTRRIPVPSAGLDGDEEMNAAVTTATENLDLGPPGSEMNTLRQYFSKTDLAHLFGDGTTLGKHGFNELHGLMQAKEMLDEKADDITYHEFDKLADQYIAKTGLSNIMETGFLFNYGMYGENFMVDSRHVAMTRFDKKVPMIGRCGGQQRVGFSAGRHIVALEHTHPFKRFLNNKHGSDPMTLGLPGKQTIIAYDKGSVNAGLIEKPIELQPYDATALRAATPDNPIAQSREFALKTRVKPGSADDSPAHIEYIAPAEPSRIAEVRRAWEPRDAAPLSMKFNLREPLRDPETGAVLKDADDNPLTQQSQRSFLFRIPVPGKNTEDQLVNVSQNMRLSGAVMKDGTVREIDETEPLDAEFFQQCKHLEITHQLPPDDWFLVDDEHRIAHEADGKPVRVLEKIMVEPQVVPLIRKRPRFVLDTDGRKQPVYKDSDGTDVFLNNDPSGTEKFVDMHGGPAVGKVKLDMTATEDPSMPRYEFRIIGFEHWDKVTIPDGPGSTVAKVDGRKVLTTWKKMTFSGNDPEELKRLAGSRFDLGSCVHSQNLTISKYEKRMQGLEISGRSVGTKLRPLKRSYIPGASLANRRTHPIPAPLLDENEAAEAIEGSKGGMHGQLATTVMTQLHRDLYKNDGGARHHPDHMTNFKGTIAPEHHGPREGNMEGILDGMTRQRTTQLFAEITQVAKKSGARNALTMEQVTNGLQAIDDWALWNDYKRTRAAPERDVLVQRLMASEHPLLQETAEKLLGPDRPDGSPRQDASIFDQLDMATHDYVQELSALAAVANVRNKGRYTILGNALTTIQETVRDLHDRLQGSPMAGSFQNDVSKISDALRELHRRTQEYFDTSNTPEARRCRTYLKGLTQAVDALVAWEARPDSLRDAATAVLIQQQEQLELGDEASVHEQRTLSIRDLRPGGEIDDKESDGMTAQEIALRNQALADRFKSGTEKLIYELHMKTDHQTDRERFWQEKDLIADALNHLQNQLLTESVVLSDFTSGANEQDRQLQKSSIDRERKQIAAALKSWTDFQKISLRDYEMGTQEFRQQFDERVRQQQRVLRTGLEQVRTSLTDKIVAAPDANYGSAQRELNAGSINETVAAKAQREAQENATIAALHDRLIAANAATAEADGEAIRALLSESREDILFKLSDRLKEELAEQDRMAAQAQAIQKSEALHEFARVPPEVQKEIADQHAGIIASLEEDLRDHQAEREELQVKISTLASVEEQVNRDLREAQRAAAVRTAMIEATPVRQTASVEDILGGGGASRASSPTEEQWAIDLAAGKKEILAVRANLETQMEENRRARLETLDKLKTDREHQDYLNMIVRGSALKPDKPSDLLVRTGAARSGTELGPDRITDEEATPASTTATSSRIELLPAVLKTLLDIPAHERQADDIERICAEIVDTGLLDNTRLGKDELKAYLPGLVNSPEFIESMKISNDSISASLKAQALASQLHAASLLARSIVETSENDNFGRQRYHHDYPQRGWNFGDGWKKHMAANAGIAATLDLLKQAIETGAHVPSAVASGFAGATLGLDATLPGGVQALEGARLLKDGVYASLHLKGVGEAYKAALNSYQEIEAELERTRADLQAELAGLPSDSAKMLPSLNGMLARLNAVQLTCENRIKLANQNLRDAIVNATSGATLLSSAVTTIGGAAAKVAATAMAKGAVPAAGTSAATAAAAAGAMGIAVGSMLTLLAAQQLGVNIALLQDLSQLHEEVAYLRGQGVDSGVRTNGNIRIQERLDLIKRKIARWSELAGGSLILVAAGATAIGTHGALALPAAGMALVGSILIGDAVYHLYALPKDLRGRGLRSGFNTLHTRGTTLRSDRIINQLLNNLNAQSDFQSQAIQKMVMYALPAEMDKQLAKQFGRQWFQHEVQRKTFAAAIEKNLEKCVPEQHDLILNTTTAEMNYLEIQTGEGAKILDEIGRDMDSWSAALGNFLRDHDSLTQRRDAVNADETLPPEEREQRRTELDEQIATQEGVIQLARLTQNQHQLTFSMLLAELDPAQRRLQAIKDLHTKVHDFTPELDRDLRDSTRGQLQDLRLRWMAAHDHLFAAMGRERIKELAQANNDREALPGQLPLMRMRFGGQTYDGVTHAGHIPNGAAFEQGELMYSEETLNWLKAQLSAEEIDKLFVKAMVYCLPDRCGEEIGIANDVNIENLRRDLKKAKSSPQASALPSLPSSNAKPQPRSA